MKITAKTSWDYLRTSYWFVPTLMAVGIVGLWIGAFIADTGFSYHLHRVSWLFSGGPEGARSLLSALIGAMITVAGVVFSITIVVLTLAAQQYGPLLLRNFLRDTGSQVVLGMFISTFTFCLLTLRTVLGPGVQNFVPRISVTLGVLLGLASIAVLVYFIHHISVFIQAPALIDVVYRDIEQSIERIFPEKLGQEEPRPDEEEDRKTASGFDAGAGRVTARGRGYVNAVDSERLLAAAKKHGVVLRLLAYPGDFVVPGTGLALVLPPEGAAEETAADINNAYILGSRRTGTQDIEFLFIQLVEVAVRTLSPGINDPFTAVIVIDHLCAALCKLAGRAFPSPFRKDRDGALRAVVHPVTFNRLADTAFGPLRFYGKTHPQVMARMLRAVSIIASFARRNEDREALIRNAELMRRDAGAAIPEKDREDVMAAYREAVTALFRS